MTEEEQGRTSDPDDPDDPDDAPEQGDQPGASILREAVANYAQRRLGGSGGLKADAMAGLNTAISNVPDGMASGLLAGVNPIYGLYACIAGPITGALLSSTQLMVIATTSGLALTAGQSLAHLPAEDRAGSLFAMVILAGVVQAILGLLRLGRLTRFVSFSVMTGFVMGIAVLTILTQLPTITAYDPEGGNRVTQSFDILTHPGGVDLVSLGIAGVAFVLVLVLPRLGFGSFGTLLGIALPSLGAWLFDLDDVGVVGDVGEIMGGIPLPSIPPLSVLNPHVVTGALALAAIGLVQGAGVSQSVPNPDHSRRSMSLDFLAQGLANVAAGAFHGIPVGGSLKTTALAMLSGARSRRASIFAGLWMVLMVLVVPGLISRVAMPALAALLIYASLNTIKVPEAKSLWSTGWPSRLAALTTFTATLFLPIQAAVGMGVALSVVISLYEASADISVVQLVRRPDGEIEERPPRRRLAGNEITVLDVYGHLFFAAARALERRLPDPEGAEHPVVILRLRGRTKVGATLIEVLTQYADQLDEAGGRLYLSGLSAGAYGQFSRTGKLRLSGPVQAYAARSVIGESTREAYGDAEAWLVSLDAGESAEGDSDSDADS